MPFGSYLLNSTTDSAQFEWKWAGLAVLFSTNSTHDFFQIFRICFFKDFIKNPQTTIALTFLTHIISGIDGVLCLQFEKFWIWSWCKDRKRKPFKSAESGYLQKIVKLNHVNLFSAEFSRLEPLWAVAFFSFFISFLRFATNCSWCDGISRETQNGCWHQCIRDICSYRWPHWEIWQKTKF